MLFTFRGVIVIYRCTASHFWTEPDSGRCLNCLTSVDLVVVSSSLPSELDANRPYSGKKADLVSFSSSSPSLSSPSLTNHSPGSFVFTTSTTCQLLAAHSDQTIINSNVTIGLEDSLNRAEIIIYSEEAFR